MRSAMRIALPTAVRNAMHEHNEHNELTGTGPLPRSSYPHQSTNRNVSQRAREDLPAMHWEPLEGHPDTYVTRWGDGRVMSIRVDNPTTAKLRSIRLRSLAGSRQWRESVPVWFGRSAAETPDEFYARVGALHRSLVTSDPHRPTALLAAMAGVPDGTAAAWVNRAKTRGVY